MPRKRRLSWTTISIPTYVRDKIAERGKFRESWTDLLLRILQENDEAMEIKRRYHLK